METPTAIVLGNVRADINHFHLPTARHTGIRKIPLYSLALAKARPT